jgi:drug/metabolite transporter (DMT)-like permease
VKVRSIFSVVPAKAWIWISILIAAASNSVVVKIQQLGASHPTPSGVNPISYCNLLFAGSVVAFSMLLPLGFHDVRRIKTAHFSGRDWFLAFFSAALAGGIAPILLFQALTQASVTGVVLVQAVEIPMVLLLAWIIYREKVGWTAVSGGAVAFAGVFWTAWYGSGGSLVLGKGELMAIGGTVAAVLSTQLSRRVLERMSPVVYGMVRNFFGIFLFAAIVLWFFGPAHFKDVFSPYLWGWTLVYGSMVVVLGQLTWLRGIASVSSADIALAVAFMPVAGVCFAWILLGEKPSEAQWIGGAVIMTGVILHLIGGRTGELSGNPAGQNASGSVFRGL